MLGERNATNLLVLSIMEATLHHESLASDTPFLGARGQRTNISGSVLDPVSDQCSIKPRKTSFE